MTTVSTNANFSKSMLAPLGSTPAGIADPKDREANPVLEKKKPGLKPGQKIRSRQKLKPALIQSIVRSIRQRMNDSPDQPFSYAELGDLYEVSTVTLRSKPEIRAAVEEARATAIAAAKGTEMASPTTPAPDEELSKAQLREKVSQLTRELANYRVYYQRLAMMYRQRGEPMPPLVAEAVSMATGRPTCSPKEVVDTVAPIFRK